jgi:pimeloyl-ACP methyl ester carboxylesterase
MTDRYSGCTPYPGSSNHHGEVEMLGDVELSHWFVDVIGSRYHFVTAGQPSNPPVIMLHGTPECWYAFHHQIQNLADRYYVVVPDLKGYGQSEKRLDLSYQNPHCAFEMALLIDKLGIDRFYLVTHDRGTIIGDHLCNVPNRFNERIIKYARMQQSFPKAHAEPRPPHDFFASHLGTELYLSPDFPGPVLRGGLSVAGHRLVFGEIPEAVIERLYQEFHYPGVAYSVPRTFQHTNFDMEMEDRRNFLFEKMTMPVRIIQGELDPGQPRSDYEGLEELGPNFSIVWIEGAGHFQHIEMPEETTRAIRDFFEET